MVQVGHIELFTNNYKLKFSLYLKLNEPFYHLDASTRTQQFTCVELYEVMKLPFWKVLYDYSQIWWTYELNIKTNFELDEIKYIVIIIVMA